MSRRRRNEWYEDEEDYYRGKYGNIYGDYDDPTDPASPSYNPHHNTAPPPHTHSGYTYKSYFYKKSFDFSVGLETRVKQLIKTISGKDLKLAQANGWGADKDYFYYNPKDLEDATDDEVLGLIFHQLARELFVDSKLLLATQKATPQYRHLLDQLEDSRVDRPMVEKYNGADYYLQTVWHALKKEGTRPRMKPTMYYDENDNMRSKTEPPIPAMEFLYNIAVLANGQTDFSAINKTEFVKAIPAIEKYLASPTMAEALNHFKEIAKFYPVPDENEQQQMDNEMTGTSLPDNQKKQAHKNAKAKETKENGKDMEAQAEQFGKDLSETEKMAHPDYAMYSQTATTHQSTINTLHKLLSSIIADNDTKRYIGRQKRGKIDGKALHKLIMLGSDRIFKKERERLQKKYAFTILIDQSGSMRGQRMDNAFAGTVILAEVFGKLRIPFQVVGFDYGIRNYKNFFSAPRKEVIGGIHKATGGGTNDRHAISKVHEQNKALPDSYNKSVFVLTDGDGQWGDTQELVKTMTTKDNIKVFGFGLGYVNEESMKQTYPKYAVCQEVEQLPNVLVDLVREQFKRG